MMLYVHTQTCPQWVVDFYKEHPLDWVKQIFYNGDSEDKFPNSKTDARLWIGGDQEEANYIADGARGGVAYFERLKPWYSRLRGKVMLFEGPNEPYVKDSRSRMNLSAFTIAWVLKMRDFRLRTGSGVFANGNPFVLTGQPAEDAEAIAAINELRGAFMGTYTITHQYGRPHMQTASEWLALRHRKLVEILRICRIPLRPFLVTEGGIDTTETGGGGWQSVPNMNWETYKAELEWFAAEIEKDSYVQAYFIFNSGCWEGDPKWKTFEVNRQQWEELVK